MSGSEWAGICGFSIIDPVGAGALLGKEPA